MLCIIVSRCVCGTNTFVHGVEVMDLAANYKHAFGMRVSKEYLGYILQIFYQRARKGTPMLCGRASMPSFYCYNN